MVRNQICALTRQTAAASHSFEFVPPLTGLSPTAGEALHDRDCVPRVCRRWGSSPCEQTDTEPSERGEEPSRERGRRASHANGGSRRSGERESVQGSPRGEAPRITLNWWSATSKCPSVPGLRGSPRRAAVPCVRIADVRANYAMGRGAGATHAIARGAVIVAGGDLSRVD